MPGRSGRFFSSDISLEHHVKTMRRQSCKKTIDAIAVRKYQDHQSVRFQPCPEFIKHGLRAANMFQDKSAVNDVEGSVRNRHVMKVAQYGLVEIPGFLPRCQRVAIGIDTNQSHRRVWEMKGPTSTAPGFQDAKVADATTVFPNIALDDWLVIAETL